ncbi:MAG: hypothetical protein ACTTKH_05140 [Treponema sp.]
MKWFKAFLFLCVISILSIAVFLQFHEKKYERYLMFFKHKITGEVQLENRYIVLDPDKESLNCFVEEFLLGPANHQLCSFFPHGMKYKTLFTKNGVLYLDLPRDSLLHMPKGVAFEDFYNLFKKSLFLNFPSIKNAYIFIEGVQAYEENVAVNN